MSDIISQSIELLMIQTVQVTLLVLLVGFSTRLFCRNRPFLALALWTVLLLKCVVPPVLHSPCGLFCWMKSPVPTSRQFDRTMQTSLVASSFQQPRLRTSSLVPGVRPVEITAYRLERIMNLGQGSQKRMPVTSWIWMMIAAALVLPGATAGIAQLPDRHSQVADDAKAAVQSRPALPVPQSPRLDTQVEPAGHDVRAAEQFAEVAHSPTAVFTAIYDVADLLEKMKQEKVLPEGASEELLKRELTNRLRCSAHQTAPQFEAMSAKEETLDKPLTRFAWHHDRLIVSDSREYHDRLAREIKILRQHSFGQVSVEVRILRGNPNWCVPTPAQSKLESDKESPHWTRRWILFQQEYSNQLTIDSDLSPMPNPANDIQFNSPDCPSASATTGKCDPIVYQFVNDTQFESFQESIGSGGVITAPKVTLFDGQTAEISDMSQRPFVTDVTQVVGDVATAYQPVIKVFWEGTRIQLASEITSGGHRLQCRFMFAAIDDCKTFRSPRFPDDENLSIQHPVISSATFECSIEIPAGKTLLIGGLFPQHVETQAHRGVLGRLLGLEPAKEERDEVTFIAIKPQTLSSGSSGERP